MKRIVNPRKDNVRKPIIKIEDDENVLVVSDYDVDGFGVQYFIREDFDKSNIICKPLFVAPVRYNHRGMDAARDVETIINSLDDDILYKKIFLVDISLTQDMYDYIIKKLRKSHVYKENYTEIIIVDHHKNTFEIDTRQVPKVYIYYTDDYCASYLFYYLCMGRFPRDNSIYHLIDLWDTWKWADYETFSPNHIRPVALHLLHLYYHGIPELIYEMLNPKYAPDGGSILDTMMFAALIGSILRKVKDAVSSSKKEFGKTKRNKDVSYIDLDKFNFKDVSEISIGVEIMHQQGFMDSKLLVTSKKMKDGKIKVSLRTIGKDNDLDVSKIAKRFGGGGHEKAAGFVSDNEREFKNTFNELLKK